MTEDRWVAVIVLVLTVAGFSFWLGFKAGQRDGEKRPAFERLFDEINDGGD